MPGACPPIHPTFGHCAEVAFDQCHEGDAATDEGSKYQATDRANDEPHALTSKCDGPISKVGTRCDDYDRDEGVEERQSVGKYAVHMIPQG